MSRTKLKGSAARLAVAIIMTNETRWVVVVRLRFHFNMANLRREMANLPRCCCQEKGANNPASERSVTR
jgi:hypothetical protein